MTAREVIAEALALGARFELAEGGFRLLARAGAVTAEMREELAAQKAEIVELLSATDAAVEVSHAAGNCLHCRELLLVFTHPLDEEVWVQCPSKPELFKQLRRSSNGWCQDCGMKLAELAGRCVECVRRVMLAPDEPCAQCGGLRFWRHLASRGRPAGFAWRCAGCDEPTGKVAIFELRKQEG